MPQSFHDDAFPLQLCCAEIQKNAEFIIRCAKIGSHLRQVDRDNTATRLQLDNHRVFDHEIQSVFSYQIGAVPDSNCFFTINPESVLFQLQNQSSAVYALNESRPQCSMNIVRSVKYAIQQLILRIHTLGLRTSYQAVTAKRLTCFEPQTKAGSQNRDVADKASTLAFLVRFCVSFPDSNAV